MPITVTDSDGDGLGDLVVNVDRIRGLDPRSPPTAPLMAASTVLAGETIVRIYFARVSVDLELFARWRYNMTIPRPVYKDGASGMEQTDYDWISDMPQDWNGPYQYTGPGTSYGIQTAALPSFTLTLPAPSAETWAVVELDASASNGGMHLHVGTVYPAFPLYYERLAGLGYSLGHWLWFESGGARWARVLDEPEQKTNTITNPYSPTAYVFTGGGNVDLEWYTRLKIGVETCYWCTMPAAAYPAAGGGLTNLIGLGLLGSLCCFGPLPARPKRNKI